MSRSAKKYRPGRLLPVVMMISFIMILAGCGNPKYKLILDNSGFSSKKTEYTEGEKVTVIYGKEHIGTDTDYRFSLDCDDVRLEQDWNSKTGYVFTFTMPAHDVKISVNSYNSMISDPGINDPDPVTASSYTDSDDLHTDTWFCPECGQKNDTLYCRDCGLKKPE